MAGKYTKFTSNYIKRSKHQNISNGSIFERNWVTTGSKLNFGKDKKPYYTEGGFIFTTSNVPTFQKKLKMYGTTNVWTYDDVKDASDDANKIVIQENSNDLRNFVYYGSCVTLVQTSIENIIKEFPGSIFTTSLQLEVPSTDSSKGSIYLDEYVLDNSFGIDLYHKDVALSDYDNPMRYMYCSNRKYTINGAEITSYAIETDFDTDCPQYDQWNYKYEHNQGDGSVIKVTINGTYVLKGYKVEDEIVFTCKDVVTIRPIDDVLVEYFSGLKGFEKFLLNCNSKPLYSNYIITPIEGKFSWEYYQKRYTWPIKDDYCIDIDTNRYAEFIGDIYDTAQKMDEIWTDNIYRNMTHEAIKNFDWTYKREYIDGDAEDNIEGGERMQTILRFCGRVFDDVKAYADGIALSNKVTYDSYGNMPNSQLKNELSMQGWEGYSIIPNVNSVNSYYVDDDFLNKVKKDSGWINKTTKAYKWYPTTNYKMKSVSDFDNDFMRRMIMSSAYIFKSKGTIEAIRMIMGMFGFTDIDDKDFSLREDYYKVNVEQNYGEKIADVNSERRYTENYDEDLPYWGLPVKDVTFSADKSTYALPFFNSDCNDKTNFYYQSKGGWGRYHNDNIDLTKEADTDSSTEYSETLSYLRMCSKVSDLFSIGQNNLKDGDIYYVYDLTDYIEAGGVLKDDEVPTHFFKVRDYLDTDYLSGWTMINPSDGSEDAKKALYLENIITNMSGNNPHTGYGNYDCGKYYLDNMLQPFANIDNSQLNDEQVNSVKFTASQMTDNDKIKLLGKICEADKKTHNIVLSQKNATNNDTKNNYYLNSKILFMKNNTKGDSKGLFKEYFRKVILPYIMQVIPSTTILILQNY